MSHAYSTRSAQETQGLGERLAGQLRGGEILLLEGDLGVGKTQLVKGMARGLGVDGDVVSPTFTLVAQYEGRLPLSHYDLYRIESTAELREIGYLEEDDPRTVRVVEWGERAPAVADAIIVRLSMDAAGVRHISVDGLEIPTP